MNNKQFCLSEAQESWIEKVYLPYRKKINASGKEKISCPFLSTMVDEYKNAEHKIMIVGQELLEHSVDYEKWDDIHKSTTWSTGFFRRQIFKERTNAEYEYKRSPFWRFMRALTIPQRGDSKEYYCMPFWTDINKTSHCYIGDTKERFATDEDNFELNKPFLNGKSVFQLEIENAQPDAVILVIGNRSRYVRSLQRAFGCDELGLYAPSIEKPVENIQNTVSSNIPILWTYHPAYLQRKKLFNDTINYIKSIIGLEWIL